MRDREAINRFCAFSLIGWQNYTTGDMDSFLAQGLKRLADTDPVSRDKLRVDFDAAMVVSSRLFGQHAFRKSLASEFENVGRSVINISLFEVSVVIIARFAADFDGSNDNELRGIFEALVRDENFARSITYSTNSTQAVKIRFDHMERALAPFAR